MTQWLKAHLDVRESVIMDWEGEIDYVRYTGEREGGQCGLKLLPYCKADCIQNHPCYKSGL